MKKEKSIQIFIMIKRQYVCLSGILIGFVFKMGKNYYSQMLNISVKTLKYFLLQMNLVKNSFHLINAQK